MLAIEAKFRIQFRPSAPQVGTSETVIDSQASSKKFANILSFVFSKIVLHRFPEIIGPTLQARRLRRVDISGFFLIALMCAIICAKWVAALSIIRFRNTAIFQSLILRKGEDVIE